MTTPAGWYDDGTGRKRWFDGTNWTEHVQDAAPVTPTPPTAPTTPYGVSTAPTAQYGAPAQTVNPYAAPAAQPTGPKPAMGLAVAALIVGIVAFLTGLLPVFGILAGAAAVALGVFALLRGQSKPLSIIGAVLGGIALLTSVIMTIGLFANPRPAPIPDADAPVATSAPEASASAAPTTEPTTAPEPAPAAEPADQLAFIALIETGRTAYNDAQTDLQRTDALATRNRAICEAVPGGAFTGWLGKVADVGSDFIGDAETSAAYVQITVAKDVTIKTWNNGLSDIGDNTMIPQGTPLYDSLVALTPGTEVRVSGSFVASDGGCVKTSNLTDTFNAKTPEFIVTFTEVTPVG